MRTFSITPVDEGRSLASLLRNAMPGAPRAFLRKVARDAATVNGAPADPSRRLRCGDAVALRESARVLELLAGGPCPLDVLHDDDDLLILGKPAGLAVHPTESPNREDLQSRAAALAPALGHRGAYHVVNRLDRWTSGVVLLAPGAERAAAFARLFERREVDKRYVALVAGRPPERGAMDGPVDGRPARTTFEVLARGRDVALVAVHPETGRRHQIRQHLAAAGHPLVGDRRYGGPAFPGVDGALLHAVSISLAHPVTGLPLDVAAPLPPHWLRALAAGGLPEGASSTVFERVG
jgi:23S rRNA pseudouridine955/2504/2580 synthase